ncbi:tubulin-like doman-containing protein [Desulfococcaceae bacterium HSG9]|nr:tubulin-like doman-containing protein [Desulfococcaceae bacterium HSG9]
MKKIQPAIVIGLGGTGVTTITYLKKTLIEQAPESLQFVRFLAIDIDDLKGEAPSDSLFGENIRLDPEKNEFFRITDQTRAKEAQSIPEIADWFPDEAYRYLPLREGAKQAKPVGRLGFFLAHEEISRWLYRLTNRVVTPEIKREFPGIRAGELNVYLVSSICGGTGAGLFIDIAYEIRYLQDQAQLPEKHGSRGFLHWETCMMRSVNVYWQLVCLAAGNQLGSARGGCLSSGVSRCYAQYDPCPCV